jgi:hypothetical protein
MLSIESGHQTYEKKASNPLPIFSSLSPVVLIHSNALREKRSFVAKQSCLLDGSVVKSAPVGPVIPNQKGLVIKKVLNGSRDAPMEDRRKNKQEM